VRNLIEAAKVFFCEGCVYRGPPLPTKLPFLKLNFLVLILVPDTDFYCSAFSVSLTKLDCFINITAGG
jgi:hypothetical protein